MCTGSILDPWKILKASSDTLCCRTWFAAVSQKSSRITEKRKTVTSCHQDFLSKWTVLEVLSIKRTAFWKEILVLVSNILYFHPEPWGNDPIWLICFRWVGSTTNQKFIVRQPPPAWTCFPTWRPHCQAAVRVEPPSYPGWEIAEPEWGFDRVRGFDTCVFLKHFRILCCNNNECINKQYTYMYVCHVWLYVCIELYPFVFPVSCTQQVFFAKNEGPVILC